MTERKSMRTRRKIAYLKRWNYDNMNPISEGSFHL